MGKRARRLLTLVSMLVVVVAAIWLVRERWEWVEPVFQVGAIPLCAVLALRAAVVVTNAWKFDLVARMFGLRLPPVEWIGLSAVTVFYGRLLPFRLGSAPRAVYLKAKYRFRYSDYVSLMGGTYLLETVAGAWMGVFALLSRLPSASRETLALLLLFTAAALGLVAGAAVSLYAAERHVKIGIRRIDKLVAQLQTSVSYYRRGGRVVAQNLAGTAIYFFFQAAGLGACFWALGPVPEPSVLLACLTAATLGAIVSITPGNLGIREGAIIGTCAVLGVPPSLATPAALLSRATGLLVQVTSGLLFSYLLFGSLKPPNAPAGADELDNGCAR